MRYGAALAICYVPMLGKYVPGKVWSVLGALHLYRRLGVPQPVAVTCLMLLSVTGILAGVLVALVFGGLSNPRFGGPWPALAVSAVVMTASAPPLLYPALDWLLKTLRRQPIDVRLRTWHVARVILILGFSLGLYGVGFACLAHAFAPSALGHAPELVGLFAFAQVAGLLAFFAPAGIGVREGVLVVGLTPLVGPGPAIVITAACRLWQTAMELVMTLVGVVMLRAGQAVALASPITAIGDDLGTVDADGIGCQAGLRRGRRQAFRRGRNRFDSNAGDLHGDIE